MRYGTPLSSIGPVTGAELVESSGIDGVNSTDSARANPPVKSGENTEPTGGLLVTPSLTSTGPSPDPGVNRQRSTFAVGVKYTPGTSPARTSIGCASGMVCTPSAESMSTGPLSARVLYWKNDG